MQRPRESIDFFAALVGSGLIALLARRAAALIGGRVLPGGAGAFLLRLHPAAFFAFEGESFLLCLDLTTKKIGQIRLFCKIFLILE